MCCFDTAIAQHRSNRALTYGGGGSGAVNFTDGWAIGVGAAYDVPRGSIQDFYKAAPNFNLSVYHFMDNWTTSVSLGYHAYQPKDALIAITDDDDNLLGSYRLSKFSVYSLYASEVYNFDVSDNFRVFAGANAGAYYIHQNAWAYDADGNEAGGSSASVQTLYLAPKVGIIFPLSSSVGLSLEGKYNFFTPSGYHDVNDVTVYKSYSLGAQFVFKF
ncbi:hypothetical protein AAFN85_29170 [Mucilaginibacter sp. CAU 1740]|uniref:hypothetical protein n=1 Tax=Mucilaginibacter sp. CAU 1740 TaxID=3140365 RepID=UPI00325BC67A